MDFSFRMRAAGLTRRTLSLAGAGLVIGAGSLAAAALSPAQAAVREPAAVTAPVNLIADPGAEAAHPDDAGGKVAVPGWHVGKGDMFTAVAYGTAGGFPYAKSPGPRRRGRGFFAGGPSGGVATGKQSVSLARDKKLISAGKARFQLGAYLGGFAAQGDYATLTVLWENAKGAVIARTTIGPVTEAQRRGVTGLLPRTKTGQVPKSARIAAVTLKMVREEGNYNDGYADNLSLTIKG